MQDEGGRRWRDGRWIWNRVGVPQSPGTQFGGRLLAFTQPAVSCPCSCSVCPLPAELGCHMVSAAVPE